MHNNNNIFTKVRIVDT